MKAICVPAFNRPEIFRRVAESIGRQPSGWKLYVSIEPSSERTEIGAIAHAHDAYIYHHDLPLGCSLNSFFICQQAIAQGAESILFMDDDTLLSLDALALCEWYACFHDPSQNQAGLALCRKDGNDPTRPNEVSSSDTWMGHLSQGWCFTRKMWFEFVLRYWWWHEAGMGENDTYDWALCYMAQKLGKTILRPRLARAQHAGAVGYHGAGLGIFPEVISDGAHRKYVLE